MIYFSKVKENLPGNTKMIEIDTNLGNLFLLREANKKPPKCIFFSFRDPILGNVVSCIKKILKIKFNPQKLFYCYSIGLISISTVVFP